jgi:hypothetical protein
MEEARSVDTRLPFANRLYVLVDNDCMVVVETLVATIDDIRIELVVIEDIYILSEGTN